MHKAVAVAALLICGIFSSALAQGTLIAGDVGTVASPGSQDIQFTIVTKKGYVRFVTGNRWSVLSMQSKAPITVAAFQIKNPADEGTPNSSNLLLSLLSPGTKQSDKALEVIGRPYGDAKVQTSKNGGWTIYRQQSHQGATLYTILDAKKPVADVIATVRLAWPKLDKVSAKYEAEMQGLFERFLQSVEGKVGQYVPIKGEVMRRPE